MRCLRLLSGAAPNRRQKRLLSETGLALGASLAPAMDNAAGGEPAAEAPPPNPYAEDPELVLRRRLRRRQNIIIAIVVLTVYYGLAILYYTTRALKTCKNVFNEAPGTNCSDTCMEGWTPADAVYFATVTMTTVGYGDLKPHNTENMLVTIIFLAFGVLVVFSRVAQALAPFYQTLEIWFMRVSECITNAICGKATETTLVDLDGARQPASRAASIPARMRAPTALLPLARGRRAPPRPARRSLRPARALRGSAHSP